MPCPHIAPHPGAGESDVPAGPGSGAGSGSPEFGSLLCHSLESPLSRLLPK